MALDAGLFAFPDITQLFLSSKRSVRESYPFTSTTTTMASSSKRIKRGDDWIPRSSFAMAVAPAPARHPAEVAYVQRSRLLAPVKY